MEEWNKGNKMIREIGKKEDPWDYLDVMEARLRSMETLASTHISWYTHKNPYGCWICDMFVLEQRTIDGFREFLGPRVADVMEVESGSKTSLDRGASMNDDSDDSDEDDADDAASLREEQEGL